MNLMKDQGSKENGSARAQRVSSVHVSSRFGERLRSLRKARNLTQEQMATRFGIDRSFISDVERGNRSISLHTLEVVAIGMDLSLSELFESL